MFQCQRIILESLARVGDRVVLNLDEQDEGYGYIDKTIRERQGQTGTIFGFELREEFRQRWGKGYHEKDGVYMTQGRMFVRWDDGLGEYVSPHHVSWWPWAMGAHSPEPLTVAQHLRIVKEHNEQMNKERQEARPKSMSLESKLNRAYLRPLPELQFYELDLVCDKNTGEKYLIEGIDYHMMTQKRSDGSPMSIYRRRIPNGPGIYGGVDDNDLELVERGNVFRHLHGQQCVFATLEEQVQFNLGMGLAYQVKSMHDHYGFTLEEAVTAIRLGFADAIQVRPGLFGAPPAPTLYKFDDQDLGKMLRSKSLEGFKEVQDLKLTDAQYQTWHAICVERMKEAQGENA